MIPLDGLSRRRNVKIVSTLIFIWYLHSTSCLLENFATASFLILNLTVRFFNTITSYFAEKTTTDEIAFRLNQARKTAVFNSSTELGKVPLKKLLAEFLW